ncbi:MAG: proline dehydrogenase family protein, partial [Phycisphaerales bacterium]
MALFSRRAAKKPAEVSASVASPRPSGAQAVRLGDEQRIRALGEKMLDAARKHKAGLLSRQFWSDKLMDWSMQDHDFKVQLFRFVDAYPTLRTPDIVHDHLVDYLTQPGVTLPAGMATGIKAGGVAKGLFTKTVSGQITGMAEKFIAGVDARDALPDLKKLWDSGLCFSVDLLGEACVSDAEADAYRDKYLDLVGNLPDTAASWKANPLLEKDHLGAVPRVNVSVKISSLSAKCDPIDTEGSIRDVMSRLVPILELAKAKGVFVNFDMEQFELKDLTLTL